MLGHPMPVALGETTLMWSKKRRRKFWVNGRNGIGISGMELVVWLGRDQKDLWTLLSHPMAKNTSETASSPSWNGNGFWELWQEHLETRPFCEHTGYQTKQSDARMKKPTLLRREMSICGRVETVVTKS